MTGSIRRGRAIIAAALFLLVACCFAIYYGSNYLRLSPDRLSPSIRNEYTFWFLFVGPVLAVGAWWTYPRSARWIVAAYGLLALLFAYFSVLFIFVPLFVSHEFTENHLALALMGAVFGLPTALFVAVGCVLAFSSSVRDFGNYRRQLQQDAFRKRQEEFRKRQEDMGQIGG
jgi:hypothetical protein